MLRNCVLLFILLAIGCHFGPSAKKYPPANSPNGIMMTVTTFNKGYSGELIEVRENGILLLTDNKLRLVLYNQISTSNLNKTDSKYAISNGRAPEPKVRERLRLLSRFPQGLSPELLQQLLEFNGQTELAGITP